MCRKPKPRLHITSIEVITTVEVTTVTTVEVLTFAYTYQDRNNEFSSLAILLQCLTTNRFQFK